MDKKYSKKYLIETGKGLQKVDGLDNSKYFNDLSIKYINGELELKDIERLIKSYYKNKKNHNDDEKEADEVSLRISNLLEDDFFTFSSGQLISIHKYLFEDIYPHAGKIRHYNFSKEEWVLNGKSVKYGDFRELEKTLEYDLSMEKKFDYSSLSMDETIEHLAIFISNLWQNHIFEEGNTRTTAVFFIKYLRNLGFDVTNDIFAKYSWYFRNALVRANYNNIPLAIYEDRSYLIKFLRNLLLNEKNVLSNRELHISNSLKAKKVKSSNSQKIIELIKANNSISIDEIAKTLKLSARTIKYEIKKLQTEKIIVRINGKRFGYWKIK